MHLPDLLSTRHYPMFKAIHDCVGAATPVSLTAGVAIDFPCDGTVRNYLSVADKPLFFPAASIFKDTIPNAQLLAEFGVTVNTLKGALVKISLTVPHPTYGDIPIKSVTQEVLHNNQDIRMPPFVFNIYNGVDSEAHIYGFKVKIECDTNATLKDRSVLGMT